MSNSKLLEYIQAELVRGVGKDAIRATLTAQGWSMSDIDSAFSSSSPQDSPVTQQAVPPIAVDGGRKAIASLVLGIVGIPASIIPIIGAPVAIGGLILGIKGKGSLKRGLAIAGIVLSTIALTISVIWGTYLLATGFVEGFKDGFNQARQEALDEQSGGGVFATENAGEWSWYENADLGFKIRIPPGMNLVAIGNADVEGYTGVVSRFVNSEERAALRIFVETPSEEMGWLSFLADTGQFSLVASLEKLKRDMQFDGFAIEEEHPIEISAYGKTWPGFVISIADSTNHGKQLLVHTVKETEVKTRSGYIGKTIETAPIRFLVQSMMENQISEEYKKFMDEALESFQPI